jgi:hypothetical protein
MFRRRFLVALVFSSLVIIGFGACGSPEDQIVDRKTFLQVQAQCQARSSDSDYSVPCVMNVFALKASEYCASHELSAAHPKCIEIQEKVRKKVGDNFTKNVQDIFEK